MVAADFGRLTFYIIVFVKTVYLVTSAVTYYHFYREGTFNINASEFVPKYSLSIGADEFVPQMGEEEMAPEAQVLQLGQLGPC